MAKITEYQEALNLDQNDVFLKDGTGGTKKIKWETLKNIIAPIDDTLSEAGKAADAGAVGNKVADLKSALNDVITPEILCKVNNDYFSKNIFSSGYIDDSGAEKSNSNNARSVYFPVNEIRAFEIPLSYRVKRYWFTTNASSGYISKDTDYINCGADNLIYITPPATAQYFRLQMVKTPTDTITESDRTELSESIVFYSHAETAGEKTANDAIADNVFNNRIAYAPSITKGKAISLDGSSSNNNQYARAESTPILPNSYYGVICNPLYAVTAYYYARAMDSDHFKGRQTFRYNNNSHKYFFKTPGDCDHIVLTFHALDWHVLTDEDVASISNSLKLYKSILPGESRTFSTVDAKAAFVAYMAQMCAKIGMEDSEFANASGLTAESVVTPADELKMAVAVAGNEKALDLWSTHDRSFTIGGDHARTVSIENNVYSAEPVGAYYKLLGGKGGTLASSTGGGTERKARVAIYEINEIPVAVSLSGPGTWIYDNLVPTAQDVCRLEDAKMRGLTVATTSGSNTNFRAEPSTESETIRSLSQGTMMIVLDTVETWTKAEIDGVVGYVSTSLITAGYSGGSLGTLLTNGGGFCAVPVPTTAGAYLNSESVTGLLSRKHAVYDGEDLTQIPASTTKVMTMLCALSIASDLQEVITLNSNDASYGGSGSTYYAGDRITVEDALRIMMMESSNIMAEAIGRIIGQKLLNTAFQRDGE